MEARKTTSERLRAFCVPKSDIAEQNYDLSISRYKEIVYEEVEHRDPSEIIGELEAIENDIAKGMADLKGMLS